MSRTLTLLRHAKSSHEDVRLADIDRPLTDRGRSDAPRVAAWMKAEAIVPDLVLCSTSVRTRQTLGLIASAWPKKVTTRFEAKLYHAEAQLLLARARALSADVRHVLFVGHNPGFHDLALRLVGAGDDGLRASLAEKYATCGCAVFVFDVVGWADVAVRAATLTHWMTPKRLA